MRLPCVLREFDTVSESLHVLGNSQERFRLFNHQ